jgi:hypothetical protein
VWSVVIVIVAFVPETVTFLPSTFLK